MDTPAWMDRAACRGSTTADWYTGRGGDDETPRLVCAACPVRVQCLTTAVAHREVHGMWGGAAGRTLRTLRQAFTRRSHATPEVLDGCECDWCAAVAEHLAALGRFRFGERFGRTRRTDFADLTHGLASTYNVGCRCDECAAAKAFAASKILAATA